MSTERIKPALLIVALIALLTFLYSKAQKNNVARHHDIVVTMQNLSYQDSLLNESILRFAADRFSNYDRATEHKNIINEHLAWIKSSDLALYGKLNDKLDAAIKNAEFQFDSKMTLIEKFKSHNGILKNSLYYLPTAIKNSQNDPSVTLYHDALNLLLREVLLFNSRPNQRNKTNAASQIEQLYNSNQSSLIEISRHAQTILSERVILQNIIDSLFDLPAKRSVEQIHQLYNEHNVKLDATASRYRTAMYVIALVLLFYAIHLLLKLRQTMRHLEVSLNELAFQKEALDEYAIVVSINSDKKIDYVNDKFVETSQFSREEVIGQPWSILDSNTDSEIYSKEMWLSLAAGQRWAGEVKNRTKEDNHYIADANIIPFIDSSGNPNRYVALLTDITERKRSEEKIFRLAHYDSLTNLSNREYFTNNLELALSDIIKSNEKLTVLFLDLDNFKMINDTLGHSAGDDLLVLFADHLRSVTRETDLVARLGGDEFTIALNGLNSLAEVEALANRIIAITDKPVTLGQKAVTISTSVGISVFPDDGSNVDTLLKNADIAMYKAKADGKNNYRFYSEQLKTTNLERHALENELRSAINHNQFELYYQPQIDPYTGHICAVEALIRWNHPEKGLVPPNDFIPVLEDSGLIIEVGKWVLSEACAQLAAWNRLGYDLRMAVNLAVHQVQDRELVDFISQLLESHSIQANKLELELTESCFLHNTGHIIATLNTLNDLGVGLSLDDFGTGYSSLSYLKNLPIDTLKIDRSFIHDLPNDQQDTAIATTILAMAKSLGLKVVAEGVETAEQMVFLKENQCEYLQGFYFSKPVPAKELLDKLQDNHELESNYRRSA